MPIVHQSAIALPRPPPVQAATTDVRFLREPVICQKSLAGASTASVSYRLTVPVVLLGSVFSDSKGSAKPFSNERAVARRHVSRIFVGADPDDREEEQVEKPEQEEPE